MAKNTKTVKERKIGKQVVDKKPGIDPKTKNTIWTVVTIIILIIFFIVNNTRTEPEQGPYPPNYSTSKSGQSN